MSTAKSITILAGSSDSILGTLFLRKHGIMLDFENQEIIIRGKQRISALPEGEGAAAVNKPRKK